MLGNNADAFFTTPMRTSVVAGGNAANALAGGMPAPYGATMPFGADAAPAVQVPTPLTSKQLFGLSMPLVIGGGIAAFLFLTTPGAKLRAKLGF